MTDTTEAPITSDGVATAMPPPEDQHVPTIDRIWQFLSSLRLAIILILGIAGLSMVGIFVIQAPLGIGWGSDDYMQWLQRVRPRYGVWTDLLSGLQLFTVATSLWMRILLALLAVSTFVCTMNRWPRIWSSVFSPSVRADDGMLAGLPARRDGNLPASAKPQAGLTAALARRGYRTIVEQGELAADGRSQASFVYADKYRYARLGTLVAHMALVGILAGTVASGMLGFRDDEFVVPVGSTRPVGFGTSLSVRADSFIDEYYEAGGPKDYRSDIVLLDRGVEVARQTIRVNEPLVYGGIRFHQSDYGPAVVLQITDSTGKTVLQDGIPLQWSMSGRSVGIFDIPGTPYLAQIIGASGDPTAGPPQPGQVQVHVFGSNTSMLGSELLTLGQPKTIGGLTYTFLREQQFTGLKVVSDPGAPIIWAMSALFVLGMAATFYFPFPRIWARFTSTGAGDVATTVAATKGRAGSIMTELDEILREVNAGAKLAAPARPEATATSGQRVHPTKRANRR